MARRFEGFVVGKQTVQQQRGWKIGRRTRRGKVNSFAPETEVVEGFEIFAGAEVTFSTEMRDGRSFALNVQPKPQQMEDSMRKLKLGLVAALILVTIALVEIFKPHHSEPIRNWIVEIRAERALDSVRKLAADQIISDDVVRASVRGFDASWGGPTSLRSISWAARWQVFNEHQCYIFNTGGYDDVERTCNVARYSEGRTDHNVWYEGAGIPVSIAPAIAEMRTELYRIGRSYLVNPANLRAIYDAKKEVVIDEYRQLSDKDKQAFLELLSTAIAAFEQFRDDETARSLYAEYIRLENAWRAYESDSLDSFRAWQDAGATLRTAVAGESFYLFAGRRYAEGGDELVYAYIEIMSNLASRLN